MPQRAGARRRGELRRRAWRTRSRCPRSTPTSRSSPPSSASPGDQDAADHPRRQDRHLGEPLRHRPGRGLRLPRLQRRGLPQRPTGAQGAGRRPGCCCPKVQVIAVGADHGDHVHDDRQRPAPRPPRAAQDALHPRRRPGGRREGHVRRQHGELTFGLLNDKSKVQPGPGRLPARTSSGDLMPIIVESNRANADLFTSVTGAGPRGRRQPRGAQARPRRVARTSTPSCSGPAVDLEAAAALADTLRVTRPAVSVILIRRRVDTSVLAEALRSGMREVVDERDLTGLGEAVKRAQQVCRALTGPAPRRRRRRPPGKLVTVFSPKGGVGKTTLAVNLAVRPDQRGDARVCLVDLDLALRRRRDHAAALPGPHDRRRRRTSRAAWTSPSSSRCSPRTAAASPPWSRRCSRTPRTRIPPSLVGRILALLKQNFDFVVVDTSPAFDEYVLQAFDETDELLLVTTLDVPTLKNVKIAVRDARPAQLPEAAPPPGAQPGRRQGRAHPGQGREHART